MDGARKEMSDRMVSPEKLRGQSLVEMALVLPVILLLVMGIFELGRIVFAFSAVNNASREAARYGAASGTNRPSVPRYLDCEAIRQQAKDTGFLARLTDGDIQIAYDSSSGGAMVEYAKCGDAGLDASTVQLGDRIVVTITKQIDPILPFIPSFTPILATARTILKDITIGNPECSDGADNDGDGLVDYPDDDGCSSPNDTIEAICYRLSVVALPEDGGTMSFVPGTNCSNRYIQGTIVNLQAFKDIRAGDYIDSPYTFDYWQGITTTAVTANPTTVTMDTDKSVTAHFRLLSSDLAVTKIASPSPVESLKPLTYQITISNPYTDTAHNLVMTDTLPSGVDFQGVWRTSRAGDAVCNEMVADSIIVCTLPELLVGDTANFEFDVVAPVVSYAASNIINTVTVDAFEFDPDMSNNTATADTLVLPRAGLSMLSKVDSVDPVDASDPFDYTITVKNSGPSVATNVVVTDILPPSLTWNSSVDCTYNIASGEVSCLLGELAVGEIKAVTFSVTAPANGKTVSNTATVTGNEVEDDSSDNSASALTQVISHANLNLVKTALSPSPVYRDVAFNYSLTVNNAGPSDALNVVITDTLPDGVQYNSSSNPFGTCSQSGNTIVCQLGTVVSGDNKTITLNVTPIIEGSLVNNAIVGSSTNDKSTGNNSDSATTTVEVSVGLNISKSAPKTISHGEPFVYTILATNTGPSTATGVTIIDNLPDGVDYFSVDPPINWKCDYDSGARRVTCTPTNDIMLANMGVSIPINVTAAKVVSPTNTATLSTLEGSVNASASVQINPSLDLSMAIRGPQQATAGNAFTYTLTVANSGPTAATKVSITSPLTSTVAFSQSKSLDANWSCAYVAADRQVVCTTSLMPAETQASFTISVVPALEQTVISQGLVSADESSYDTDPLNDSAILRTVVED